MTTVHRVSFGVLKLLAFLLEVEVSAVFALLDIEPETRDRIESQSLSSNESEYLLRLLSIGIAAADLMGPDAYKWLSKRCSILNDCTPLECALSEVQTTTALELISRLEQGALS